MTDVWLMAVNPSISWLQMSVEYSINWKLKKETEINSVACLWLSWNLQTNYIRLDRKDTLTNYQNQSVFLKRKAAAENTILGFSKLKDFRPIRWIRRIGQNHPCMNQDLFTVSLKHRKHSSVMVKVADRITHAWIGFNYSLTQTQKTF